MEKKGGVLLVVGIVILSLIVLAVGAGIYFYNFYVFKTVRICLGDAKDTGIPCNSSSGCIDLMKASGKGIDLGDAPNFVKEDFQKVVEKAIYCEKDCMVKNIRGVNKETRELEFLDSCNPGEEEILIKIHGKEGLEILNYMKRKKT